MANKAMKERHWDRIATVTGHKFDVESENFLLRNIMEAPLLEHKEDIEVGSANHILDISMFKSIAMTLCSSLLPVSQEEF